MQLQCSEVQLELFYLRLNRVQRKSIVVFASFERFAGTVIDFVNLRG